MTVSSPAILDGAVEAASSGHTMQVDLLGCISNTQVPLQSALLPVFEAVVNGIHSTQDRYGEQVGQLGFVEVHVHRVAQTSLPGVGRPPIAGITGFTIKDNGIGFIDANLDSFKTAYSRAKVARGGKGMGRFSWLVLCRRVHISSVFQKDGNDFIRSFYFTTKGIESFTEQSTQKGTEATTAVKLEDIQKKYFEPLRHDTEYIADRLFEHCFDYLVMNRCPRIHIRDESVDGITRVEVNDKLKELSIDEPCDLQVGEHLLRVRHVQRRYRGDHHEAHLCAHHRVVTSFPLSQVSDLGTEPLRTDGEPVVHHVFVGGDLLDQSVDSTRTRFDLAEDEPLSACSSLDMKTLRAAIGDHVNQRLASQIKAERAENFQRIERHIRDIQPEYQYLLKRTPEQLQTVKWSDNRVQLDESLYRVQQGWEADVRRRQGEVTRKLSDEGANLDEIAVELDKIVNDVNEVGRANLVRYVARRHVVLAFMRQLLRKQVLEKHIHRLVFPLNRTDDNTEYEDHNLWLLDDTLAFYEHIASDVSFKGNRIAPVDSPRRPDILAFKTGEPYQHVAIVEFKRPERSDENPVQQLVDYAVLLRDGGARSTDGATLPGIPKSVRIDAYAIATLTPELEKRLRTGPGNMKKSEDDWRWVGRNDDDNLTIELVDFRVFVRRAEQRNKAFFNKLGLP